LYATSNTWNPETVLLIDLDNSDCKASSTPGFPVYWLSIDLPYVLEELVHSYALKQLTKNQYAFPIAIGYSRGMGSAVVEPGGVRLEIQNVRPIHLKDGNFQ